MPSNGGFFPLKLHSGSATAIRYSIYFKDSCSCVVCKLFNIITIITRTAGCRKGISHAFGKTSFLWFW